MDLKEIAIDMKAVVVEIIQENVDDENKNKINKQEEVVSVDEKKDVEYDKQDVALTTSNVWEKLISAPKIKLQKEIYIYLPPNSQR